VRDLEKQQRRRLDGSDLVRQCCYTVRSAARAALLTSINELSNERVRNTETRIIEGGPAEALLEVAGSNPAHVIVVGNRGLGAADGRLLGSVPGDVAKNAQCDVLMVQTSDVDGDPVSVQAAGKSDGDHPVT